MISPMITRKLKAVAIVCLITIISACSAKDEVGSKSEFADKTVFRSQSDFINQTETGSQISGRKVSKGQTATVRTAGFGNSIDVSGFSDSRYGQPFVQFPDREMQVQGGDAGILVEREVARVLGTQGFVINEDSDVRVSGSVEKWQGVVSSGRVSEVQARAVVTVDVVNDRTKRTFKGRYNGRAHLKGPKLDEPRIVSVTNRAMKEALDQMFKDKKFQSVLR